MADNTGKAVVITGGTKGIGAAIAEHLADLGYSVALSYGSDQEAAEALRKKLSDRGSDPLIVHADGRKREEIEKLFEEAKSRFGSIYGVIANAGLENVEAPFAEMSPEDLDRIVDLNVKGTFYTLQQAARNVVDNGRIIATASTIALYPPPNSGAYASSKAAVRTMVEVLALEMGHRGITVNSLNPGPVKGSGIFTQIGGDAEKTFAAGTPMGRMVEASDLSAAVAFLLSEDARLMTAHHLAITAGFRV
jgi:3-oxoacyl-[acyl-carrier protein] reductase